MVAHIEPAAEQDLAIQVAALGAGDTWTEADWQRFLAERDDPERLYWIDIAVPRLAPAGQLGDLLRDLHSDPLVLDRCLDPDAVSGVFLYEGLLGLQLPVPMDWEASSHPKLTLLCLPSALVTVRVGVLSTASDLAAPGAPVGDRHVKDVGELLAEVLDELVDLASERVLHARGVVDDLEADLESPAQDDGAGNRTLHLNRALAHFEMALEAKHRTLTALLAQQSAFINLDRVRERLRDVVAHVEHSLRYLERMEDHLSELHQHYLLLLQDRTNSRLRLLTILSAIFMPLTLIAGIYGMNFEHMPELSWRYGYPAAVGAMLLLAVGLMLYFYRRGWFR